MAEETQRRFISRIRQSLGRPEEVCSQPPDLFPDVPDPESRLILENIENRKREDRMGLLETLIREAAPLNLNVIPVEDSVAAAKSIEKLVLEKEPEWGGEKRVVAWKHPLIQGMRLDERLSPLGIPVHVTDSVGGENDPSTLKLKRGNIREQVIASFIGVTAADYCVASTATLVMKTRPGQARSVSLVPSIHVAVIGLHQIVADLKEFYTLLKWDPAEREEGLTTCMTLISGPSKTGDIELVMVHGAHGPRELYLYVMTGEHSG